MKRLCAVLILLAIAQAAHAQSVVFGKRLVSRGDDIARVREIAGSPDKLDKIPAASGSPAMEIWTYRRKQSLITLWIVDAKVVQAEEKTPSGESGSAPGNTAG